MQLQGRPVTVPSNTSPDGVLLGLPLYTTELSADFINQRSRSVDPTSPSITLGRRWRCEHARAGGSIFFSWGRGGEREERKKKWDRNGIFYQHVYDVFTLYTMHIMLYGICMSFCIRVSMCVSILFCVLVCICAMCSLLCSFSQWINKLIVMVVALYEVSLHCPCTC